jgi:hypothetical protein
LIAAALIVVCVIPGILYESFIHPFTILSTLLSAGVGALLPLQFGHTDLSVIGIIRRIHLLLRREGRQVNRKRVYRLYREMGLQLRNKTPKRRVP